MIHANAAEDREGAAIVGDDAAIAEGAGDGFVVAEGEDGDGHFAFRDEGAVIADFIAALEVDCFDDGAGEAKCGGEAFELFEVFVTFF